MSAGSDLRLSETPRKTAQTSRVGASKRAVEWVDVLRAVQHDWARLKILELLARSGFKPADLGSARPPREALADALTRTEDWLEYEHPRWPDRESIKAVRRRLELELWP